MASHRELLDRIAALEKTLSEARIVAGPGLTAAGSFHHGFAINATGEGLAGSAQPGATTPATECPPPDAPAHMAFTIDYATVGSYVTDCHGSTVSVTGSAGYEGDLSFVVDSSGDCSAGVNQEDSGEEERPELEFTCPTGDCGDGQNGHYKFFGSGVTVRWDGSTWWLDIYFSIITDEDLGICGWDTANADNLNLSPCDPPCTPTHAFSLFSVDIGASDPVGTHIINITKSGGGAELTFTVVIS